MASSRIWSRSHVPHDAYPEAWDIAGLAEEVKEQLNLELPLADWAKEEGIADEELRERLEKPPTRPMPRAKR